MPRRQRDGLRAQLLALAGYGDGGQPEGQRCGKYDPSFVATVSPSFVDGWLGMLNGGASKVSLGVLPTLWTPTGPLYILGGLLFGIATFRSRICRVGLAYCWLRDRIGPVAGLLSLGWQPKIAIPAGASSGLVGVCALV